MSEFLYCCVHYLFAIVKLEGGSHSPTFEGLVFTSMTQNAQMSWMVQPDAVIFLHKEYSLYCHKPLPKPYISCVIHGACS